MGTTITDAAEIDSAQSPVLTYIIGDIHGCYDEFRELEEIIWRHAERFQRVPFIVAVGDLIDRGPNSAGVVKAFRRGMELGTHITVAGNHEAQFYDALLCRSKGEKCTSKRCAFPLYYSDIRRRFALGYHARSISWEQYCEHLVVSWLRQGGNRTLESFGCFNQSFGPWRLPEEDIEFLRSLPLIWENDDVVVSHAQAHAADLRYARRIQAPVSQMPDYESLEHLAHVEGALWNRKVPITAPEPARLHVSGHTPQRDIYHDPELRILRLDTGCVYGNALSAWCVEHESALRTQSKQPHTRTLR